jgi:DNA-binding transcriptional MerR regulator
MKNGLSIQQAADSTGLSVHTLRYYERIGLMDPVKRFPNGHRYFDEGALEWIDLLLRLRSTGMTIKEMQRFADMVRSGETTIAERRKLLEVHEMKLQKELQDLKDTLSVLQAKISTYRSWELEHQAKEEVRS